MAARWLFFRRRNRRLRSKSSAQAGAGGDQNKTGKKGKRSVGPSLFRRALSLSWRLSAALAVCALCGAAIYGGRYFLYHSARFALREVKVTGTKRLTTSSMLRRAALPEKTNLLRVDTRELEQRLLAEPWLKAVAVRRELPGTLRIDLTEHEPAVLLALESLYLCDAEGMAFKRATPGEGASLPVVTGVGRATYVLEPVYARAQIDAALQALGSYQKEPSRPAIGEIHIDRFVGATLYTKQGLAIELGRGDAAELQTRLVRFDAVWKSLRSSTEGRPVMVFLDNHAHPDHVTVRFAQAN
jgi:cell division septal protein FtsQ